MLTWASLSAKLDMLRVADQIQRDWGKKDYTDGRLGEDRRSQGLLKQHAFGYISARRFAAA